MEWAEIKVSQMKQKNFNPCSGGLFCQNAIQQVKYWKIMGFATAAYHSTNGASFIGNSVKMWNKLLS